MDAPVAVGAVIAERYRVEGLLGEGGMGVVVRATHLLLKQQVAIKFVRRDAVDDKTIMRVLTEAQAAARVQSEHVMRIQDVAALEDGTPYIVMEYVEGEDLASILTYGPLHVRDAVRWAVQICEALTVSHAAGVIHGDLKPENIYIAKGADGAGKVKLLDFGIAKGVYDAWQTRTPADLPAETRASNLMGTPAYMAPEQFNPGPIDPRMDLWALGAVLYEMLTGRPPFEGETPEAVARQILTEHPRPIDRTNVEPGLEAAVMRCLSKDPEERFASAVDLACALEPFLPVESTSQRLAAISTRNPSTTISQRLVPTVVISRRASQKGGWLLAGFIALLFAGVVFLVGAKTLGNKAVSSAASPQGHVETTLPPSAAFGELASAPAPPPPPHTGGGSADPPSASSGGRPKPARRAPAAAAPPRPVSEDDRFGTRK